MGVTNKESKRRQELGVQRNSEVYNSFSLPLNTASSSWYNRIPSSASFSGVYTREDSWQMLRRAKDFLSRRLVTPDLLDRFDDSRRSWMKNKSSIRTVLDLFPSLKYSYSSLLPRTAFVHRSGCDISCRFDDLTVDVVSSCSGSFTCARVNDVSRSHCIRLDPVDSSKELYRYRLRVQACLDWARQVGLAPIMMTLTVFHRWHSLKGLVSVLKKAWNYFFTGTRAATRRAERMGLCGYIRRMEETLNRGCGHNSGWHPHYHVILFIPRDKLSVLSDMEDELREAWFKAVTRYFSAEFGESIPLSYVSSFRKHGLWLSRCFDYLSNSRSCNAVESYFGLFADFASREKSRRARSHNLNCEQTVDNSHVFGGVSALSPLRIVDNGVYIAKIMGWDPSYVYGGDKEMTSLTQKDCFIPFDLLREDTAENNDLWVEYALAMKGELNFYFSQRLTRSMKEFYEKHPEKRPKSLARELPSSTVIAQVGFPVYKFFYNTCGLKEFFSSAAAGYDSLFEWCRKKYCELGFPELASDERFLPKKPVNMVSSLSCSYT